MAAAAATTATAWWTADERCEITESVKQQPHNDVWRSAAEIDIGRVGSNLIFLCATNDKMMQQAKI